MLANSDAFGSDNCFLPFLLAVSLRLCQEALGLNLVFKTYQLFELRQIPHSALIWLIRGTDWIYLIGLFRGLNNLTRVK